MEMNFSNTFIDAIYSGKGLHLFDRKYGNLLHISGKSGNFAASFSKD